MIARLLCMCYILPVREVSKQEEQRARTVQTRQAESQALRAESRRKYPPEKPIQELLQGPGGRRRGEGPPAQRRVTEHLQQGRHQGYHPSQQGGPQDRSAQQGASQQPVA